MDNQQKSILNLKFIERIRQQFPCDSESILMSMDQVAGISLRINPAKFPFQTNSFEQVPWCTSGVFLQERPVFTLDPLIHAGAYYVQEASSMFLEQAFNTIDLEGPKLVLDLCGAPGGKSTHLLSLLSKDDLLVSNEVIHSRVHILNENIRKWGVQNVLISNNDPKDFQRLNGFFDVIVVDAPCSGEGLFRRDQEARNEWSVENANLCSVRQRRILSDIWPSLKTGGYLIYSTCTFNPEENEENLKWLKSQTDYESIAVPLKEEWNIDTFENEGLLGYRFLPHKVKGEGFFITVLRKIEDESIYRFPKKSKTTFQKVPAIFSNVKQWMQPGNFDFHMQDQTIVSYPSSWRNELIALHDSLKVVSFGMPMAELKGNSMAPTHNWALAIDKNKIAFGTIELEFTEAIKFLHKDEIILHHSKPDWNLVTYLKIPLGLVKNLGNRANNYYPKEWRIRMSTEKAGVVWYDLLNPNAIIHKS